MTVSTMLTTMAEGMVRTCGIFFLTLLFSLPLGMIIMLLRRSRITIVSEVMKVLLAIVRGTPLMRTTPAISRRSSAAASKPSRWDSMKRQRSSAIIRPRPFSTSSFRR